MSSPSFCSIKIGTLAHARKSSTSKPKFPHQPLSARHSQLCPWKSCSPLQIPACLCRSEPASPHPLALEPKGHTWLPLPSASTQTICSAFEKFRLFYSDHLCLEAPARLGLRVLHWDLPPHFAPCASEVLGFGAAAAKPRSQGPSAAASAWLCGRAPPVQGPSPRRFALPGAPAVPRPPGWGAAGMPCMLSDEHDENDYMTTGFALKKVGTGPSVHYHGLHSTLRTYAINIDKPSENLE